jgi:pimeloyl-ACP methyl ester carboxylesterase
MNASMGSSAVAAQQDKRPKIGLRRILAVVAVVIAAILIAGYFGISAYAADKLSRPERFALTSKPSDYGLKYDDVVFTSTVDNIQLSGWYIDSAGDKVIIMMHGRNGRRDGGDALEIASKIAAHNYDVFMFDFRAHGASGGERYSMGQWEVRDVEGALNYLKARGVAAIGAHSTSMGGSPMLYAAVDHPEMKALVADSSFADLAPILEKELPKASGLPAFFNPGIFFMGKLMLGVDLSANKPADAVAKLGDRPLLIIQSSGDTEADTIPATHAIELQKAGASNPNLQVWLAPGEGHCAAYSHNKDEYMARVLGFYDTYLK